ncbi:hypothetical protein EF294_08540 [Gordonia oryzae]|uniref:Uncharacterized protein n=1 Tax=Gordonia oryzae TaxID=2487349 RepID=A0A3N4GY34_9ACTN|nr:hypothetical protein [Gordonia oryzae]RPA63530.1 hypothetical protein EF294_08540 [Gordonia oryzae]
MVPIPGIAELLVIIVLARSGRCGYHRVPVVGPRIRFRSWWLPVGVMLAVVVVLPQTAAKWARAPIRRRLLVAGSMVTIGSNRRDRAAGATRRPGANRQPAQLGTQQAGGAAGVRRRGRQRVVGEPRRSA